MASSKPVILLIPGAWHCPASYQGLVGLLQSSGHEVHVHDLPSMNGSRPPTADLETDTAEFREHTKRLAEAGRSVVVIVHSYSGQVASNALHGLGFDQLAGKGGVVRIISLCAFTVREGVSMIDVVERFGHGNLMPLAFDFADDKTVLSQSPKALLVTPAPNIDDAEVEKHISSFSRWNGNCMYQPLTTTRVAWRDIPVTYVYATGDMTVPFEYQRWMVETMRGEGAEVETFELESGHSPAFTNTREVVEIINTVMARY
ncbi:alpha/beta-hydrolase [Aspergillus heteromorphus CBS 117.55]|uniref:Alpha/beta-hydrolase n=1 Tax=Aspergillus heteromorphus CBS 117.55 TaxID=1448321 RepID=A0A317WC98_9EURO|nr:alpha/beta-hydrolase [Aspergillus heteromorphus CBS 117.55]PWY83391.1 alpha/beta-hydrolase [Aspergillus heteromorphus CBS 117.55]